jgi:hypothetical protein
MAMDDNSDIDLAIARVQAAIATSDLRAVNGKLAKLNKSRTDYGNRKNQTKAYKPNGVTASNFKYEIMPTAKKESFRAGERGDSKPNPRANEYRAGERGQGTMKASPKKDNYRSGERSASSSKAAAPKKDTSFKKAGLIPAITGGDSKKFKDTFNKKGLLPALRGK